MEEGRVAKFILNKENGNHEVFIETLESSDNKIHQLVRAFENGKMVHFMPNKENGTQEVFLSEDPLENFMESCGDTEQKTVSAAKNFGQLISEGQQRFSLRSSASNPILSSLASPVSSESLKEAEADIAAIAALFSGFEYEDSDKENNVPCDDAFLSKEPEIKEGESRGGHLQVIHQGVVKTLWISPIPLNYESRYDNPCDEATSSILNVNDEQDFNPPLFANSCGAIPNGALSHAPNPCIEECSAELNEITSAEILNVSEPDVWHGAENRQSTDVASLGAIPLSALEAAKILRRPGYLKFNSFAQSSMTLSKKAQTEDHQVVASNLARKIILGGSQTSLNLAEPIVRDFAYPAAFTSKAPTIQVTTGSPSPPEPISDPVDNLICESNFQIPCDEMDDPKYPYAFSKYGLRIISLFAPKAAAAFHKLRQNPMEAAITPVSGCSADQEATNPHSYKASKTCLRDHLGDFSLKQNNHHARNERPVLPQSDDSVESNSPTGSEITKIHHTPDIFSEPTLDSAVQQMQLGVARIQLEGYVVEDSPASSPISRASNMYVPEGSTPQQELIRAQTFEVDHFKPKDHMVSSPSLPFEISINGATASLVDLKSLSDLTASSSRNPLDDEVLKQDPLRAAQFAAALDKLEGRVSPGPPCPVVRYVNPELYYGEDVEFEGKGPKLELPQPLRWTRHIGGVGQWEERIADFPGGGEGWRLAMGDAYERPINPISERARYVGGNVFVSTSNLGGS